MTQSSPSAPAHYAGLDGLRAIAVALVIAYHLFPGWIFPGGFAGVDVFFVLSGFLITSLLLSEEDKTGHLRLGVFWKRRARRLLPALALVVTVCASAAWLVGGDVLTRIGWQILGAVTFSFNWLSPSTGSDYFAADTPELFRNLWSLAVEEQFYVLWPLVLPLLLLVVRRPWMRALIAVAAAAGSAAWMAYLVGAGGELTRVYFGTDTHAFGILFGVALAFLLQAPLRSPSPWMTRKTGRAVGLLAGLVALGGIVGVGMVPATDTAATFPGALLTATALTVLAIAAGVWPGSWFGRLVDVAPLKWVGDRSYGLYLWHWPLLVLLSAWLQPTASGGGVPVWMGFVTLATTVVAAEASYRLVEMPVRRQGFRGTARALGRALSGPPGRRLAGAFAVAAGIAALGGTTAAIAAAQSETSAESVVQAGIDALADQGAAPSPTGTAPTATPAAAVPSPSPTPIRGDEITAVGDSVMLASAPALVERFPGIHVDATVSRSMWAGPDILAQLAANGQLRRYVVVALGTNGPVDPGALSRVADIVGPDRELILVNASAPRSWIAGVNTELSAFANGRAGVELADWSAAIAGHQDLLAGDLIHPGGAGGRLFADTVAAALDRVEFERAEREFLAARGHELNEQILRYRP